ncbi:MAG TPA: ABC transporter substrate-binding protein [candidate division Zixibacteria bacterium]|nr:ABC transporter substrate-binding protein [candidate division Zixibacteria bacterium]
MMCRISLFVFVMAAALGLWSHGATARAGVPTEQIRATVDRALLVLKDPRFRAPSRTSERREQLRRILFARFDFTEMARRSLGANWRRRTPQEQEEFVRLFTDLLERTYADTIESYTDEKILYVGERVDGGYADVSSKIVTAKGEEFSLNYKAHLVGGEWKVYDIVVENVSLVNNFRSQFNRVIANGSYEELIRRLRSKQADLTRR